MSRNTASACNSERPSLGDCQASPILFLDGIYPYYWLKPVETTDLALMADFALCPECATQECLHGAELEACVNVKNHDLHCSQCDVAIDCIEDTKSTLDYLFD